MYNVNTSTAFKLKLTAMELTQLSTLFDTFILHEGKLLLLYSV